MSQFLVDDFSKHFRLDKNINSGGVMIFVREDIPNNLLLKHFFAADIGGYFIELNLKKCEWYVLSTIPRRSILLQQL